METTPVRSIAPLLEGGNSKRKKKYLLEFQTLQSKTMSFLNGVCEVRRPMSTVQKDRSDTSNALQ